MGTFTCPGHSYSTKADSSSSGRLKEGSLETSSHDHDNQTARSKRPQPSPARRFDSKNWKRSLADLLSVPLTHLVWSLALRCSITNLRPDLFNVAEFCRGAEGAFRVVFGMLASSRLDELYDHGLV